MSGLPVVPMMSRPTPLPESRSEVRVESRADSRSAVRAATARAATARAARTAREDAVRDASDAESREEKARLEPSAFAQMLAMLALQGEAPTTVAPDETASLVEALLDDVAATPDGDAAVSSDAIAGMPAPVLASGASSAPYGEITEAELALRNGMLALPRGDRGDVIDLAAYARAREARGRQGLAGLAGALDQLPAQESSSAADALTRIAARRGASLEQLLAVGDTRGADARAALDAILARAGTPEGLSLANAANARALAQQLLQDTDGRLAVNEAMEAEGSAAGLAHAAALAAGLAASAANPGTPVKDLSGVAPELRERVARVIDRMKQEYGHDVAIVETTRSQERQDWLYAQGRTRDGQVVTWTRDSAHTRGEAVDVIIDGRWDNPEGYGRLQRIAREEGLRTLGMKDPGHLELANGRGPQDLTARVDALRAQSLRLEQGSVVGSASVAQVSGVAQVAGVARVADAAAPVNGAANSAAYTALAAAAPARNASQGHGHAFGRGERDEQGKPLNDGRKLGHDAGTERDGASVITGGAPGTTATKTDAGTPVRPSEPVVGSTQAQRVSDIQALRADAPASPLNRMTLNVDGANGVQQQVTVDLRGNVVSTHITTDRASAERMRLRTADLQDALGRHGLDSDTVRISGLKPVDGADGVRAAATDREALKVAASTPSTAQDGTNANGQRERAPSREWNQDDARRDQASRARDQREQRDEQSDRRRPRPDFLFGTP